MPPVPNYVPGAFEPPKYLPGTFELAPLSCAFELNR
jgi:hypothetical protein